MKRMFFFILLLLALHSEGQDFSFSQFYEIPMLRNPSLAGIFNGDIRVTSAYKSQWGSVSVPYRTTALGIEYKLSSCTNDNYVTLGTQFAYDVAGDLNLKKTQVLPSVTYHKLFNANNNSYISGSVMGEFVRSQFDPSAAKLDDQFINGAYSPSNVSAQTFARTGASYMDVAAGVSFSSTFGEGSHYYFGVGMFHILRSKLSFLSSGAGDKLERKVVLNAGLSAPVNDHDQIIAYADYYRQGGSRQVTGGALYETTLAVYEDDNDNTKIAAGCFYRWNDAVIPVVKLYIHGLMLGVSYDINVSQLKTASQMKGGFELTLSFLNFFNRDCSSRNKVLCPGFGRANKVGWFSTK